MVCLPAETGPHDGGLGAEGGPVTKETMEVDWSSSPGAEAGFFEVSPAARKKIVRSLVMQILQP